MEPSELLEPFERMLAQLFPPARVRAIDAGGNWDAERTEIEASGFLDALAPEDAGGAGLSFAAVAPLFIALGRHAAPMEVGRAMIERGAADDAQREAANAVLLAAGIAGAGDRLLAMSVAYAGERVQFGKPVGRQQALQQQLAVMAEDAVSVRLAVELACAQGWPTPTGAAVAKTIASAAAPRMANTAHAVHGAIGISAEYDLQLYTRRLHAWRRAVGAESLWAARLGRELLAGSAEAIDWARAELFAGA
ncbi:MAG: acyl-CoA dehydrogenase family protein [Tsuneonella sp.]